MTTIRTKCPACGDVDLGADAIQMSLSSDGDRGEYTFTCPVCMDEVSKPASRRTVALLVAAGVVPSEAKEAATEPIPVMPDEDLSPYPGLPAFTLDDAIVFHWLLEDDVALADEFALQ